jgi:molecular chaperone HscA
MLKSSFGSAEQDKKARALREAIVDANRLIEAITAALNQDGELLSEVERVAIEAQIKSLKEVCNSQDSTVIHKAVDLLNHATENFAAKRMDASVRKAFAGQDLNKLEL